MPGDITTRGRFVLRRWCSVGRTIPSFRMALEQEIATWSAYRKALGHGSSQVLDKLFNQARSYCSASSNAVRPVRFEGMLMAMVFAHERRLEDVARQMEEVRLALNGHE